MDNFKNTLHTNMWDEPEAVAPLRVTYTDGTKQTFPAVRFQKHLSDPDPVVIDGSTVKVETLDDRIITILNVRWMEFL